MPRKRSKPIVWIIMHYAIFSGERIDSVEFHVSSSLRAAERYIAETYVDPYSWWQVHPHILDEGPVRVEDGTEPYYIYSHTGRPLKRPPFRRAIAAYRRAEGQGKFLPRTPPESPSKP